ncbi:trichothecene C-15 esterase [Thozetella sp. PMI_491]|nr:trichothecene C-15 esterase [Thozetella sp. PMI_491]
MLTPQSFLLTSLLLSVCIALPCQDSEPIPPSRDPWYTAPDGFELRETGTVLRTRRAPGNVTSIIGNCSAAYNILYRTTDTNDQPSWAVTTLLLPNSTVDAYSGAPLLSYQVAYDTAAIDGSPSYIINIDPATFSSLGIPADTDFIAETLANSWYVTIPDYEGPLGSFGEGPQAAHAVLDGVKASSTALREIAGVLTTKPALWGYSGGAIASGWAAELQSSYAPDLEIAGVAAGGLAVNFTDSLANINGSPLTGDLVSAIIGIVSQFAAANASIAAALKTEGPYNATGFWLAGTQNVLENIAMYYAQDVRQYFTDNQWPLYLPAVNEILDSQAVLGYHGVPKMPYFAYMSVGDEVGGIHNYDLLVEKYCAEGANILFQRNSVGDHVAEITNGKDRAIRFLASIFDGTFSLEGCKVENVTVAIVE